MANRRDFKPHSLPEAKKACYRIFEDPSKGKALKPNQFLLDEVVDTNKEPLPATSYASLTNAELAQLERVCAR